MLKLVNKNTIGELINLIENNNLIALSIKKRNDTEGIQYIAEYRYTTDLVNYDTEKVLSMRDELIKFYVMLKHDNVNDFYLYYDSFSNVYINNKSYKIPQQDISLTFEDEPVNLQEAVETVRDYIQGFEDRMVDGIMKVRKGKKNVPICAKETLDLVLKAVGLDGTNK